jgi:hypothetical protein
MTETTLILVPILVGVVVGWLIGRWWALVVALVLGVAGLLALVASPIDDDIPRWWLPASVAWMVAVGMVLGLLVRGITVGHRGAASAPRQ